MVKLIEGYKYLICSDKINFSEDTNIRKSPLSSLLSIKLPSAKLELILILEHLGYETTRSLYHSLNYFTPYTKILLINEALRHDLGHENIIKILEPNNFCFNYLQKRSNDDSLIWISNEVMTEKSEYLDKQLKLF